MIFFKKMPTATRIQWLVWLMVLLLLFFTLLPEDGLWQSACYALQNTGFYAIVIYGNISFLFPQLYQKDRKVLYVISSLLFLVITGICRAYLMMWTYNAFFAPDPHIYTTLTVMMILRNVAGMLTIFLLSFIFRIAIAYFTLKRQAEEMILQKTQTELNLLKAQVQPHFLFNTLNNIYYEAYRESPHTAALIERLSEIMRYFVDESPKDKVNLSTEINFLENYIALEKIRIRHEIALTFTKEVRDDCFIPPMLLMTFVENIFKHGIDKTSTHNPINISLIQQGHHLLFKTSNELPEDATSNSQRGSGIENLRKRLTLLYGNNFELQTGRSGDHFNAFLTVPI